MKKLADNRPGDLGISIIYLFGSRAEKRQSSDSDLDIGVVFKAVPPNDEIPKVYSEIYDVLTDHFRRYKIDIVFLQEASLELRFDAISHGIVLYQLSDDERFSFEEATAIMYADYRPLLDEFDRAILDRI